MYVGLTADYQEDLVFSRDKSTVAWYRGEGSLVVLDVASISVIKKVNYFTSTSM